MFIDCEMINTVRLMNISIISHDYCFFYVCDKNM